MYMDPVKPFAFMIISLFLGALPFTALFFYLVDSGVS